MSREAVHTGPHDLGGVTDKLAPLDLQNRLLVQKGLMSLDELRRATEQLPAYEELSYYEKWAAAGTAIAIERGTISRAELDAQLGPDPATLDNSVRFTEGDHVRVKQERAAIRWRRPHLRTPGYIFGQGPPPRSQHEAPGVQAVPAEQTPQLCIVSVKILLVMVAGGGGCVSAGHNDKLIMMASL
eukprot:gene2626-2927_t